MSILIKNGLVLNPATGMEKIADVLVENDKVSKIEENLEVSADEVIDASGCYVMPGFIDLHVHFRDPGLTHKEDVITGMAAAAAGGYTSVLCMPNTKPVADCPEVIEYVQNKARDGKCVKVFQVGAVTKGMAGAEVSDIEGMVKAGCVAISEDGKSVMNSDVYRDAMKIAAKLDIPVLAHCEDINLVHGGVMNMDSKSDEFGLPGISNAVEDIIVARDILLAKETGARLHLCHCSTADSVKMVDAAVKDGIAVSAEVCPHHFALTSDDIKPFVKKENLDLPEEYDMDTNYKMNPPLRTQADVDALKKGIADGIMTVISTDHAPHSEEEKNNKMQKAPFGIVGLETAACLTHSELVLKGLITPMQMAACMSYNPASVMKFETGDIQPGKPADIAVFDPNETYVINKYEFASKGKNTPFHGTEVTGRVKMTICDGRIVYRR